MPAKTARPPTSAHAAPVRRDKAIGILAVRAPRYNNCCKTTSRAQVALATAVPAGDSMAGHAENDWLSMRFSRLHPPRTDSLAVDRQGATNASNNSYDVYL